MKASLVGAGPGDPGLLTLRAKELLSEADVVIYDALANPELLDLAPPKAERLYVGKIADKHALPQEEINALIAQKAREGKNVVRLKGGDPYIFGRGGEEAEYLEERGIPFEEVPGISSAIAAPAYAGIPLTHRDFTSSVIIATGHERAEKAESSLNWRALAQSDSTLVFVMGMKNLPNIVAKLLAEGLNPDTPGAVIYRGCSPRQKTVAAPLSQLAEKARAAGLGNPAVVVIGKVVSLRPSLDWFAQRPLFGKRVVVTRARAQASEMSRTLRELGAEVMECPVIRIKGLADYAALDMAIDQLATYDWLLFTSVNGVKYFWERLGSFGLDSRAIRGKVAAIGPATSKALAQNGIRADFLPESYVAESVAEGMKKLGPLTGARVLLPRALKAREVLPDELARAGAIVDVVPIYETVPESPKDMASLVQDGKIDCISFASSSTVENFLKIVPASLLEEHTEIMLAAIGPITARTMRENGLRVDVEPTAYTITDLAQAIASWYQSKKGGADAT